MAPKLTQKLHGKAADPELLEVAKRRKFSSFQKMNILDEIDRQPENLGLILRREGLYSSHLFRWRRWRANLGKNETKDKYNELAKAKRKIASLELKLKKAESIIDLQKKFHR